MPTKVVANVNTSTTLAIQTAEWKSGPYKTNKDRRYLQLKIFRPKKNLHSTTTLLYLLQAMPKFANAIRRIAVVSSTVDENSSIDCNL